MKGLTSVMDRIVGSVYLATHLIGQARFPFKSLLEIERVQNRRVRAIVKYAYQYVPYYHETMQRLGLTPADFQIANDLEKLPILERNELQRNPEYFLSTQKDKSYYLEHRSGGSCGQPVSIYHDKTSIFLNAVTSERDRSILVSQVGKPFGYKETIIGNWHGSAYKLQLFVQENSILPYRIRIQRQHLSVLDSPEKNIPEINAFQPDVIQTYGSYLAMLYQYAEENKIDLYKAKVVTYSSDGLPETARKFLMNRLGLMILSTYQSVEAFKIGFECLEHCGLHVNTDLYPMRIVDADGNNLPPGQPGDVVISNLINHGTVLLNYRLGDLAVWVEKPCACERKLPLITFPQGRKNDVIRLPSGRFFYPQAWRTALLDEAYLWQYQIIQHNLSDFQVLMVVSESCRNTEYKNRILQKLIEAVGEPLNIQVEFVDAIERTPAGKFRVVVSLLPKKGSTLLD